MHTTPEQADALRALFNQFANRLETDWEKRYKKFGTHWSENLSSSKFHEAVASEINAELPEDQRISTSLVRRILREKRFAEKGHLRTYNAFSRFVGYPDWKAFAAAHPGATTTTAAPPPDAPALAASTTRPVTTADTDHTGRMHPISVYMIALGVVLLTFWALYEVMAFGVARQQEALATAAATDPGAFKRTLFDLIERANAASFAAYEAIPDADVSGLSAYYTTDGSAYGDIMGVIQRSTEAGNTLVLPTSGHEVWNYRLIDYTNSTAHVRTTEKWKLLWHAPDDPSGGILYDELNEQDYFLVKNDAGEWRIRTNHYEGSNRPPSRAPVIKTLQN